MGRQFGKHFDDLSAAHRSPVKKKQICQWVFCCELQPCEQNLENLTNNPLEIIEIQTGDYLEEDDIIRLEDKYERN